MSQVRGKIERLERLLPGVDGLAVVSSRPQLLGFDVRTTVARKVSRLREILGLQADIAVAVARCPSLLTMSSENAAGKLEKLQEALPSALEARCVFNSGERGVAGARTSDMWYDIDTGDE